MQTSYFVRLIALAVAVLSLSTPASGQTSAFVVVVNEANPTTELAREDLARIFLKRQVRWSHGTPITAMDQPEGADVRKAFSVAVHDRSATAIRAFWQQQIFSGRDIPPVEKPGDAEVMRAVADNVGGVGYVLTGTRLAPGVRAVTVIDG
jgi:ABC-type phosphate transport system substrate-binding protein